MDPTHIEAMASASGVAPMELEELIAIDNADDDEDADDDDKRPPGLWGPARLRRRSPPWRLGPTAPADDRQLIARLHEWREEVLEALRARGWDLTRRALAEGTRQTPLHIAVEEHRAEDVEWLVRMGAAVDVSDVAGRTPLDRAADDLEMLRILIDNSSTRGEVRSLAQEAKIATMPQTCSSVLLYARRREIIEFLVDNANARVDFRDKYGRTALHSACDRDLFDVAHCLLERGANPNAADKMGNTPLHKAAVKPHNLPLVKMLVEHGANVDAVNIEGATPVFKAILNPGHTVVLDFLLQNSNDPDFITRLASRQFPLHQAILFHQTQFVEDLLVRGADPNIPNVDGWTPLTLVLDAASISTRVEDCCTMAMTLCAFGAVWPANGDELLDVRAKRYPGKGHGDLTVIKGLRACIDHWIQMRGKGNATRINVPPEVVKRGSLSVKAFLMNSQWGGDHSHRRCKICVVGASECGKTTLIKSFKTKLPSLVHPDDRTVGVELCSVQFEDRAGLNNSLWMTKYHDVTFWDFAGQDRYHIAHALFFSKQTLYMLCVDMDAYAKSLQSRQTAHATAVHHDRESADEFVQRNVIYWIEFIFARQVDAKIVVIGTMADLIDWDVSVTNDLKKDFNERLQKFRVDYKNAAILEMNERRGLTPRSYRTEMSFLSDESKAQDESIRNLEYFTSFVDDIISRDWLIVSCIDALSILHAFQQLKSIVVSSGRSCVMSDKHMRVLEFIRRQQKQSRQLDLREQVTKVFRRHDELCQALMKTIIDLSPAECKDILQTLHDIGDVLWYKDFGVPILGEFVLMDPELVVEFIRQVVSHTFSSNNANNQHLQLHRLVQQEGRFSHELIRELPYWDQIDNDLMLCLKSLLQNFRLAYPAGGVEMRHDSDLIVPSYWNQHGSNNQEPSSDIISRLRSMTTTNLTVTRGCWEYHVPRGMPTTLYEQFVVASFSASYNREVTSRWFEAWPSDNSYSFIIRVHLDRLSTLSAGRPNIIRIEVAAFDAAVTWFHLQVMCCVMETVLEAYPGAVVSRFLLDNDNRRHHLGQLLGKRKRGPSTSQGSQDDAPWVPPELSWYENQVWKGIETVMRQSAAAVVCAKKPRMAHPLGLVRRLDASTYVPGKYVGAKPAQKASAKSEALRVSSTVEQVVALHSTEGQWNQLGDVDDSAASVTKANALGGPMQLVAGDYHCTGYYVDDGIRMSMTLEATFIEREAELHVSGAGMDVIGSFWVEGVRRRDGFVVFTKRYETHMVQYGGTITGESELTGTWEIPDGASGSFTLYLERVDTETPVLERAQWRGSFDQFGFQVDMCIDLEIFGTGRMDGRGSGSTGPFVVKGRFVDGGTSGRFFFLKIYRKYAVSYEGKRRGSSMIGTFQRPSKPHERAEFSLRCTLSRASPHAADDTHRNRIRLANMIVSRSTQREGKNGVQSVKEQIDGVKELD